MAKYIAATSKDEDIYLYYFSGKRLWYQKFAADFSALAMSPDAQHILVCDTDGHLKMLDNNGKPDLECGVVQKGQQRGRFR